MSAYRGKYPRRIRSVASLHTPGWCTVDLNDGSRLFLPVRATGGCYPELDTEPPRYLVEPYARPDRVAAWAATGRGVDVVDTVTGECVCSCRSQADAEGVADALRTGTLREGRADSRVDAWY
jgi:hypothetical protein